MIYLDCDANGLHTLEVDMNQPGTLGVDISLAKNNPKFGGFSPGAGSPDRYSYVQIEETIPRSMDLSALASQMGRQLTLRIIEVGSSFALTAPACLIEISQSAVQAIGMKVMFTLLASDHLRAEPLKVKTADGLLVTGPDVDINVVPSWETDEIISPAETVVIPSETSAETSGEDTFLW